MICPNCNYVHGSSPDPITECVNCGMALVPLKEQKSDTACISIVYNNVEADNVYGPREVFDNLFADIWNQIKKAANPDAVSFLICGYDVGDNEVKIIVSWKNVATLSFK